MSKATFRNDSGATVYLEEYGHQQIVDTEVVTIFDDNQSTKFADSTQLIALINAGDVVYIDDLSADRTATDAIQILEAIRDKVVAGGADGEYLCTDAIGDLVWGAGAIVIKDEGVQVSAGNCTSMNFTGPPVTVVDAGNGQVDVTVLATAKPTGLTDFHEVFRFYEQGSTGDIYMMRADSLISNKYPAAIALANGRVVHITSSREKDANKFCDIVVRKQTASATSWSSGTWTDVGAALTMNNTVLSDTFTNLVGYTFNAGDGIAVYLDKGTPVGGASVEDPFVAVYVKYD